jgi:pyruvate formate lyase activating enzyme
LHFLSGENHVLDAVTITGGEPTIHNDLISFIQKIKLLGFRVKLDTNGTNPKVIEQLQKEDLVDYVCDGYKGRHLHPTRRQSPVLLMLLQ